MKQSEEKLSSPAQAQPRSLVRLVAVAFGALAGVVNVALAIRCWTGLAGAGDPILPIGLSRQGLEGYLGAIAVTSIIGSVSSLWMVSSAKRAATTVLIAAGVGIIAAVLLTMLGFLPAVYYLPGPVVQLAAASLVLSTIRPNEVRDFHHS
jgi:hypothetical protein